MRCSYSRDIVQFYLQELKKLIIQGEFWLELALTFYLCTSSIWQCNQHIHIQHIHIQIAAIGVPLRVLTLQLPQAWYSCHGSCSTLSSTSTCSSLSSISSYETYIASRRNLNVYLTERCSIPCVIWCIT